MRARTTRTGVGLVAAAVVGMALPLVGAPPASAAYDGFNTEGWATPIRIEVHEPTIPIPASPQLEVNLSFSRVKSQTGQLASLGSWLWPGDPLGNGLKTFGEQLGLPGALTDGGYPVQVNAVHPGGEEDERQEPMPGAKMRATAGETETRAQAGFALAEEITEGDPTDGQPGGGGGVPDLSSIPLLGSFLGGGGDGAAPAEATGDDAGDAAPGGVSALVDGLLSGGLFSALSGAAGGGSGGSSVPGLPPEIALLVDIGGMSSTSRTVLGDDEVRTVSRSALGDISIAGGLITLEGITAVARTTGDGEDATHSGTARIGGLRIAGQLMAIDENGITAAGEGFSVPGLEGAPQAVLGALGITLTLPGVVQEKGELQASVSAEALRVEIDLVKLKGLLDILPLSTLIDALPAEAAELANLLDTVKGLAPRIVVSLGNAHSSTQTVPEFEFETGPASVTDPDDSPAAGGDDTPTDEAPADDAVPPADTGDPSGDLGAPGDVPAADPVDEAPAGDVPAMPDNQLTSSGLPPLNTIPGLLLWGGLALGALAGTWLRRMGLLVLGGGAACTHGFATGLPDLRKA